MFALVKAYLIRGCFYFTQQRSASTQGSPRELENKWYLMMLVFKWSMPDFVNFSQRGASEWQRVKAPGWASLGRTLKTQLKCWDRGVSVGVVMWTQSRWSASGGRQCLQPVEPSNPTRQQEQADRVNVGNQWPIYGKCVCVWLEQKLSHPKILQLQLVFFLRTWWIWSNSVIHNDYEDSKMKAKDGYIGCFIYTYYGD